MYCLSEFTEEYAKEACSWQYDGEYAIYNYPPWETVKQQNWAIADEKRRSPQYVAVLDETGALCGFFRFIPYRTPVMLGLGFAPQLCGKGHGAEFMELILKEFHSRCPGQTLELEVREFNRRAVRCYERAGFVTVETYYKETALGNGSFFKMQYVDRLV